MTFNVLVLILVVFGLFLMFHGKARELFKGFVNLFVADLAKTPKGAAAIYEQKIEQMQEAYNKSSDGLQKVAGQLDTAQRSVKSLEARLADTEHKADAAGKLGNWDAAGLYAQERDLLVAELENARQTVVELTPILEETKQLHHVHEQNLTRLKREKEMVISAMERNIMTKQMYDMLDGLKRTSDLDKLYGHVQDGAKEKQEMAVGARVEHENRLSTKLEKADAQIAKATQQSYLDQLKAKYPQANAGQGKEG